ncbi:MAG TPA: hypothetical protein VKE69_05640 [Planctomycetota bacterium]|nr:hypothetical protein [Planctomycetota bacterium]
MREFRVTLTHRAGELARLAEALAAHGINLRSVAAIADGHKALVCLVAEDVNDMRSALEGARMQYEEDEVLTQLLEDEPGQVAELASKLGAAGVNLRSLYVLAREKPLVEMGFTVDDPRKAKKALGG